MIIREITLNGGNESKLFTFIRETQDDCWTKLYIWGKSRGEVILRSKFITGEKL